MRDSFSSRGGVEFQMVDGVLTQVYPVPVTEPEPEPEPDQGFTD